VHPGVAAVYFAKIRSTPAPRSPGGTAARRGPQSTADSDASAPAAPANRTNTAVDMPYDTLFTASGSLVTLSIVIPVFNEHQTIRAIVEAVLAVPLGGLDKELVIVDDYSTDGTRDALAALATEYPAMRVLHHAQNQGKGAALRTGFAAASGDIVLVQDADLEYDPRDYPKLIQPILEGRADVVFGSRFVGGESHRVLYFWHSLGNKFLTLLSNMFTDLNLTDMETCYKVLRRDVLAELTVEENRFGFEPEITAKVAKLGCRVYEVGISYAGRTYNEGKKIGWRDGVRAIWCILKYNLWAAPRRSR